MCTDPRTHSMREFQRLMTAQLDLRLEADHIEKFKHNFRDSKDVQFARVYRPYVSECVLVESYEEGIPIHQFVSADPTLRKRLAHIGIQAFLKMIFSDNVIHGDLHPGNIFVKFEQGQTLAVHLLYSMVVHVSVAALNTDYDKTCIATRVVYLPYTSQESYSSFSHRTRKPQACLPRLRHRH